jgi:hypothetical protein
MDVCRECGVLSGWGLFDEVTTRPEEFYRKWCVVVCNLETARTRKPWFAMDRSAGGELPYFTYSSWIFPCCSPMHWRPRYELVLWKNDRCRSEIVVYIRYISTYPTLSFLFSVVISPTLQFIFLVIYDVETNAADRQCRSLDTDPFLQYTHT